MKDKFIKTKNGQYAKIEVYELTNGFYAVYMDSKNKRKKLSAEGVENWTKSICRMYEAEEVAFESLPYNVMISACINRAVLNGYVKKEEIVEKEGE